MNYKDVDEALRFGTDAECRQRLEDEAWRFDELKEENRQLERRQEILEEQVCFAQTLLDEIEEAMKHHARSPKQLCDAIKRLIEDSGFER